MNIFYDWVVGAESEMTEQDLQDFLRTYLFKYLKKQKIGIRVTNKFTWTFFSYKKNEIFVVSAVPILDLKKKNFSGYKFYVKEFYEPNRNNLKGLIHWMETMGIVATVNASKNKIVIENSQGDTDYSITVIECKSEDGIVPQFVLGTETKMKDIEVVVGPIKEIFEESKE